MRWETITGKACNLVFGYCFNWTRVSRVYSSAMLRDSASRACRAGRGKTPWGVHTSQAIFNALTRAKHARLSTQVSSFWSKRMLQEKYLQLSRDSVQYMLLCTEYPYTLCHAVL